MKKLALSVSLLVCSSACAGGDDASSGRHPTEPVCTSCGDCAQPVNVDGNLHVTEPVDYASYPPAGGDHFACWSPWGAHAQPVITERWVHNLEHGGIVFLYGCDPEQDEECAEARAFFDEFAREHVLGLSTAKEPNKAMKTRFAAVSWGQRLETDCFDEEAFRAFYDVHVDNGLESVTSNPPASCNALRSVSARGTSL